MVDELTGELTDDDELLFERHRITVDPGQKSLRVDRFLSEKIAHTSRNRIQQGIAEGFVRINGNRIKSNYKVQPGDEIIISLPTPPPDTDIKPENIPISIHYEDAHLLVINKPAGMVVHPAHKNWTGTLVNALIWHFNHLPELPGNTGRPGLVHRIDKDTSGLMVVAKDEVTLTGLARQFFEHSIDRIYWALVWGDPPEKGTIRTNLGRSQKDRRLTIVLPDDKEGKEAITHYQVLERFHYVTLVECRLETGRTHQIRAHLAHLGHPLFNDTPYGGNEIVKGPPFSKYKQFVMNCFAVLNRQALHAKTLGFIHPVTKEKMHFNSDLPDDFQAVLEKWRKYKLPAA